MTKPRLLDLCCGSGGWAAGFLAAGWDVTGVDVIPQPLYPGTVLLADVRELAEQITARDYLRGFSLVVASPPCEAFSRHDQPWTRKRNPPDPDKSIWHACESIGASLAVPFILENVRGAQTWMGRAKWHCGPYYLWGDVPALMPRIKPRHKERMSSAARLARARVPYDLALYLANTFRGEENLV